jgi:hypothetical protein
MIKEVKAMWLMWLLSTTMQDAVIAEYIGTGGVHISFGLNVYNIT